MEKSNLTAVEWLEEQLSNYDSKMIKLFEKEIEQAKEMEKQKAQKYAEFAIKCDRIDMKVLNFEGWIKL